MKVKRNVPRLNLQSGMTLGRNYFVVEFLGSGWEGEVYKVEERDTGILRAAKIFYDRPGLRRDQIRRYARKLYKLRQCYIVTQYHHRDVARVAGPCVELCARYRLEHQAESRPSRPSTRSPVTSMRLARSAPSR